MPVRKAGAAILLLMLWGSTLAAQTAAPGEASASPVSVSQSLPSPGESSSLSYSLFASGAEPRFTAAADPAPLIESAPPANDGGGVQTKRIAGFVPNFQAVSADVVLPPLSFKQKFMLANQNTFDYSSFAFVGFQAGIEEATNTYPEFHKGEAGFVRYYWRT